MKFEWDKNKRRINLQKHGIDFADVPLIFEYDVATDIDDRFDYGEIRFLTLGILKGNVVVVAHTETDEIFRIIPLEKLKNMNKKSTSKQSETDWERLKNMKDEEIDFSDIPPITPEMFKNPLIRKGIKSASENSLEIDRDIIDFFKSQGRNYREKINEILRAYIQAQQIK